MNNSNPFALILLGLFTAAGIASGGYFISQTMYNAKVALNTAEAKGLAERRVKADQANWTINYSVAGIQQNQIPALYKQSETNQKKIIEILKENGLTEEEIQIGVIDYFYREFRNDQQILVDQRHELRGAINVETTNVDVIAKARSAVNKLIAQGIRVENQSPQYRFTSLNAIKPEMLKEATQNAQIAANEFAGSAGAKVGKIRDARQGSFYIRDAGSEYGDTQKIEKDVRVVTTITFYLED